MINASGIRTYLHGMLQGLQDIGPSTFSFSLLGDPTQLPKGTLQQIHTRRVEDVFSAGTMGNPKLFRQSGASLLHSPHYNLPYQTASHTVVTVHDLIHLKFPQYWPSMAARAYARFFFYHVVPRSRAVLTVSEHTKKDLIEMLAIPAERIHVTYNGVDQKRFAQKRSRSNAALANLKAAGLPAKYLLYVGNL